LEAVGVELDEVFPLSGDFVVEEDGFDRHHGVGVANAGGGVQGDVWKCLGEWVRGLGERVA
jgi:hypothetical protein